MKIKFEPTSDEFVDLHLRLLELKGTKRLYVWQWGIFWTVLGVMVFDFLPLAKGHRFVPAIFWILLIWMTHWLTHKHQLRSSIRSQCRSLYENTVSEYELSDDHLVYRSGTMELRTPWDQVQGIHETKDYIEIITKPLSVARFPTRIFKDSTEKDSWLRFINGHAKII